MTDVAPVYIKTPNGTGTIYVYGEGPDPNRPQKSAAEVRAYYIGKRIKELGINASSNVTVVNDGGQAQVVVISGGKTHIIIKIDQAYLRGTKNANHIDLAIWYANKIRQLVGGPLLSSTEQAVIKQSFQTSTVSKIGSFFVGLIPTGCAKQNSCPQQPPVQKSPAPAPTSSPAMKTTGGSPKIIPDPSGGIYFGGFVQDNPEATSIADFERRTGQNADIVLKFLSFGSGLNFPTTEAKDIRAAGGVPFIKLEPWSYGGKGDKSFTLADIISGKHDAMLKKFAQGCKAYGGPIFISFGHEMNGNWYPWAGDPKNYKLAYQHVHDVMVKAGATNITWVFNPDVIAPFSSYYPGDKYVDWVMLDGYNTVDYGGISRTPREIFGDRLDEAAGLRKPMGIGETGCDDNSIKKPEWLKSLIEYVVSDGRIKALVYFDTNKAQDGKPKNWKLGENNNLAVTMKEKKGKFDGPIITGKGGVSAPPPQALKPGTGPAKSVLELDLEDATRSEVLNSDKDVSYDAEKLRIVLAERYINENLSDPLHPTPADKKFINKALELVGRIKKRHSTIKKIWPNLYIRNRVLATLIKISVGGQLDYAGARKILDEVIGFINNYKGVSPLEKGLCGLVYLRYAQTYLWQIRPDWKDADKLKFCTDALNYIGLAEKKEIKKQKYLRAEFYHTQGDILAQIGRLKHDAGEDDWNTYFDQAIGAYKETLKYSQTKYANPYDKNVRAANVCLELADMYMMLKNYSAASTYLETLFNLKNGESTDNKVADINSFIRAKLAAVKPGQAAVLKKTYARAILKMADIILWNGWNTGRYADAEKYLNLIGSLVPIINTPEFLAEYNQQKALTLELKGWHQHDTGNAAWRDTLYKAIFYYDGSVHRNVILGVLGKGSESLIKEIFENPYAEFLTFKPKAVDLIKAKITDNTKKNKLLRIFKQSSQSALAQCGRSKYAYDKTGRKKSIEESVQKIINSINKILYPPPPDTQTIYKGKSQKVSF